MFCAVRARSYGSRFFVCFCYSGVGVLLSFDALPLPGALSVSLCLHTSPLAHTMSLSPSLTHPHTHTHTVRTRCLSVSFFLARCTYTHERALSVRACVCEFLTHARIHRRTESAHSCVHVQRVRMNERQTSRARMCVRVSERGRRRHCVCIMHTHTHARTHAHCIIALARAHTHTFAYLMNNKCFTHC